MAFPDHTHLLFWQETPNTGTNISQTNPFYSNYCLKWTFWSCGFWVRKGRLLEYLSDFTSQMIWKNAMCGCGISWSYSLAFLARNTKHRGQYFTNKLPLLKSLIEVNILVLWILSSKGTITRISEWFYLPNDLKKMQRDCGISWHYSRGVLVRHAKHRGQYFTDKLLLLKLLHNANILVLSILSSKGAVTRISEWFH